MDLPKIRYFLQEQQTFRRGVHNRENYQKYVKCAWRYSLGVFGLWRNSLGVFGGILGCLRCATQDLLGDNRRTGVKMDLIEDTILTASPHLSNVK